MSGLQTKAHGGVSYWARRVSEIKARLQKIPRDHWRYRATEIELDRALYMMGVCAQLESGGAQTTS